MIARLIAACARRPGWVFAASAVAFAAGLFAAAHVPVDAIPDLSDPQVILFTEWMGRSPDLVEDQVTYPLVSALVGAPRVVAVRGQSMFGMSFIYVIFQPGTDVYWARSRVLEYLSSTRARLPDGVTPTLGPDATSVGWIFQYALVDRSGRHDLAELRALQDFHVRYALSSVPGVAEVATVGGYERQYQVEVDPTRLQAHGLSVGDVTQAIRRSNREVGGRVIEMSGREYFVRGRGYVRSLDDLRRIALGVDARTGTPVRVADVGRVSFGPDIRRGVAELDGEGEAVGGTIVMRDGENALQVIRRVKEKLAELAPTLPPGVRFEVVYDRSSLIHRAIGTLRHTLIEEAIVVSLIIFLFLLHFRSTLVPVLMLPLAVALAFLPMWLLHIDSNIMSLGGIAIAIGAMVDAAIVLVENAHKHLETAPPGADRRAVLIAAAQEVGPAIFFSLLIITVAFLPIFALNGQAGRLFKPLAWTKTFSMAFAALVSVTLAPALMVVTLRGRIRHEAEHPVSRAIIGAYRPFAWVALHNPRMTVAIGLAAVLSAAPLALQLGHEFMPPLNEGDVLYMPTTFPNISIEEAKRDLQVQDRALKQFPEVVSVFGKAGRSSSPTDPAPLAMVETVVQLKAPNEWRELPMHRWYSSWAPAPLAAVLRPLWPDHRRIRYDELTEAMDHAVRLPGWTNAWTMPIKTRIDMLSTGVRTPVGIKVSGASLDTIERIGMDLERIVTRVPHTRSVYADRSTGGFYVDIVPDRDALARYGLSLGEVQDVIEAAIGGEPVATTVEGPERFTINVRYPAALRQDLGRLRQVLVPVNGGAAHVPLGQLADIHVTSGPPMIRDEGGMLTGYVYVDMDESAQDLGGYVASARRAVASQLRLPPGYLLRWTGQYELLEAMQRRMRVLVPLTLLLVFLLLYLQFGDLARPLIVLLSVPFALVGSVWLLAALHYHLSTAVWVGLIALVGLATQTGIVMIVYCDGAYEKFEREGRIRGLDDILAATLEGSVQRVRPKLMTVATMLIGLVPLLWSTGSGADVMKRVAAPMVGGLITSAFLTLEIIPVVYAYWRYWSWRRAQSRARVA